MAPSTPRALQPTPAHQPHRTRPSTTWSSKSDLILTNARAKGLNWHVIARTYFPHKTANACRKRHERLLERRNSNDWDTDRLEKLATGYLDMRKAMWTVLADAVGERWQVVEAKCIESGLKALATAAKCASRRAIGSDEDDSGIGSDVGESTLSLEGSDKAPACGGTAAVSNLAHVPSRPTRHGPTIASLLRSPHA